MSELKTIAIIGGLALGAYFLFKKRIDNFADDMITPLQGDGKVSIITPIPDMIYNWYEQQPKINIKTPDADNIFSKSVNAINAKVNRVQSKVRDVTDKNSSYKGYTGELTVQGQGYSVREGNAVNMAKSVYVVPKKDMQSAQSVYTKIKVNPYS